MKHRITRVFTLVLAVLMVVSLCACGGNAEATTTTGADGATTTVADVVTTTIGDTNPTDGEETPTDSNTAPTTAGKNETPNNQAAVTTQNTTVNDRPWEGATAPQKKTTTSAKKVTTSANAPVVTNDKNSSAEKSYATLPNIQYDAKYDNPHGVHHTLLSYTGSPDVYSKSMWLNSVGYIKDGKVQGVLYDSFIILPSPNFIYYGDSTTKKHWDSWRKHTYKNLDTLNEAAKQVQEDLNLKEYKVKVFTSIWEPTVERNSSWGTINGASYGARNNAECLDMVKYMVDGYVAEIAEKKYSNIEFVGFYWFDEALDTGKGQWYIDVTDYIHSKNLIVVQAPYFKSRGWNYGKKYGIDLVAMQSNHFHSTPVGTGNSGSIKRLAANAGYVKNGDTHGITVECSTVEDYDDITTLKMTFEAALQAGTDSAYHIYYFGGGAKSPYNMSRSTDEYIRSGYDELYKYINRTLTLDELWIKDFVKEQPWPDGIQDIL